MCKVFGRNYDISVHYKRKEDPAAARLVIVSFQPNETAQEILRLCIDSILHYTDESHELWVIDNCSPAKYSSWLADEPDLNLIFNRTPPAPPTSILGRFSKANKNRYPGSYANAVALEIAAKTVDPKTRVMMSLHMDTMVCCQGWLSYLQSHMNEKVRAVGVRMDTTRVRAIHVLGLMFDFNLYRTLNLSFMHNMPNHDCGDGISIALEREGYELWAAPNSMWEPAVLDRLHADSPFRDLAVDRSLNDKGEVFFMHLGRGVEKSVKGGYPGKTNPDEWVRFGRQVVLGS